MTKFLASVNNLPDAVLVANLGADIVDLKQPSQGALGALSVTEVKSIVDALKSKVTISATVGDLEFVPEMVVPAVQSMLATGVDIVKIGLFPGGHVQDCLDALRCYTQNNHQLIAVLFADSPIDLDVLAALAEAKFTGVMLDTMHKTSGRLTELLSHEYLSDFISIAKHYKLLTGLAGSLQRQDIPDLLDLKPDYLGFRGALCQGLQRNNPIDTKQVSTIRELLAGYP